MAIQVGAVGVSTSPGWSGRSLAGLCSLLVLSAWSLVAMRLGGGLGVRSELRERLGTPSMRKLVNGPLEGCTFMCAVYPGGGARYVKHRDALPYSAGRKLTVCCLQCEGAHIACGHFCAPCGLVPMPVLSAFPEVG